MDKLLNKKVLAALVGLLAAVAVTLGAPDVVIVVLENVIDALQPAADVAAQ